MDFFILIVTVPIIILFLSTLFYFSKNKKIIENKKKQNVKCPICNSYLFVDENIISKVYRPMNVPDQLCTISGCPHCFPVCELNVKRFCPVCHTTLSNTDTLTARLFNKTTQKKHVHIIGCSHCHKPRAK